MSGLRIENSILVAKLHTTDNDPVPTGAANAMLGYEINLTPLQADEYVDSTVRGFSGGAREKTYYNKIMTLDFKVDFAGSGTPGTAPAWDPLVLASGAEKGSSTASAVLYKPANFDAVKRVAIYFYIGGVLHKMIKARGNMDWDISVDGKPFLKFSFVGLFQPVIDAAVPTADFSAFKKGIICTPTNTPIFTVHGYGAKMKSFSGSVGATVEARRFAGGYEEFEITKREATAKAVIEATTVAEKDFWGIATAHTKGDVAVVHGLSAGNICKVDLFNTQLGLPSYSDDGGKKMLNIDLTPVPLTVNSEWLITVQ